MSRFLPPLHWPRSTGRLVLAVLVLVAYNTWLLGPWVDAGAILRHGLISELAADTRPWHDVFRAGDVITGGIVVATTVAAQRHWGCTTQARLFTWALLLTGFGIMADGIVNLTCSATLEPTCHATGDLFTQPWRHQVHAAMSFLYSVGMFGSLAVVALRGLKQWRPLAAALLTLQVVANSVLAVSDLMSRPQPTWLQICSIVVTSVWLASVVAWGREHELTAAHPASD